MTSRSGTGSTPEAPYRAHLDHKAFLARGRRRASAARSTAPHGLRRTDVTGNLIITRLRDHLGLPCTVIAALFAIDPSSVSRCSLITRKLLAETAAPLPPPACPPAGTAPAHPGRTARVRRPPRHRGKPASAPADTSPHATLTAPDTPQTQLILKCALERLFFTSGKKFT